MQIKLENDKNIHICLGDITKLAAVDAIVNAAHRALLGGGGVDGAIHKAAGEGLLMECRDIPCDNKGVRCKTGEAHITKGYNLPAKHVIHTVAPIFVGGIIRRNIDGVMTAIFNNVSPEDGNSLMAECYRNCIELAERHNLKSIAFPSLGTGGHAYPIEIACPIAIKTVIECLKKTKSVKDVVFVCFSSEDWEYYEETATEIIKTN